MMNSLTQRLRAGLFRRGDKTSSPQRLLFWTGLIVFFATVSFAGWAASAGLGAWLRYRTLEVMELRADSPVDPLAPVAESAGPGVALARFTEANPFRADLPPRQGTTEKAAPRREASGTALSDLTLTGTLPPEGAFFQSPEGLMLLLRGDEIDGYELVEVRPGEVILHKGDEEVFLKILFSGNTPRTTVRKPAKRTSTPKSQYNVQPAEPGKEGALDRELVNQLLMNPFEELKRLRLRPRVENGQPVGIEVRYIRKDSIFRQLGVQRGDVIQGVNGIEMNNMNDVANAISSLMGGSRFDVTVLRNGNPETLSYAVR